MDGRRTPQALLTTSSIVPVEDITADPASPLGKSTSAVFKGTWKNAVVAIKKLPSDTPPEALHSRVPLWESLKHSHVLEIFAVSPPDADPLFIVMQYYDNGSATQFLEQNPSADRSKILYETALGMQYIHNRGLVHGSLKPSNILITDYQQAVVADCGMCEIAPSLNSVAHQYFGPDAWKGTTSRGADVYAFGMSALEIFQSKLPWGTLPESKLIIDEVWNLIQECWRKDSRSRPSFNKILEIWPMPDPALTPLPPPTDSTFSQPSPGRLSLTELQMRDALSRTPDIESPHEPPAYEAAHRPVLASPVPIQRVRTSRLMSAPSPWGQSSRHLPPPPLALGGNTNPGPISSRAFKQLYNPNPPDPAAARRFSDGPSPNSNAHSTRSNSWSPPPTSQLHNLVKSFLRRRLVSLHPPITPLDQAVETPTCLESPSL
ncbi:hypothetical protein BS47DRAFT_761464 [Hydnum rufescens UP504]|uniref:Protein kinase domain-containing protein n=1 Tax=Hydnum rufescens UP504 TaxID=1448309 RepID=A0A9P6E0B8_9AGAM|nr:hypothetical protein BS47DRAFT_761464 [Hydnum rufescens UP504]